MNECHCDNIRRFEDCCEPFLKGVKKPRSVKQLMRSRYTAFALGGHEEYLYKTWHPARSENVTKADLSNQGRQWKGLEIIRHRQKGDIGRVEFKAVFSEHGEPDQIHHEKSAFVRVNGAWLYLDGEIDPEEET